MAINKESTINVHHSPLRSRQLSARRPTTASNVAKVTVRNFRKKSQSKKTHRSRSKSVGGKLTKRCQSGCFSNGMNAV
jgi:hypothetical protein